MLLVQFNYITPTLFNIFDYNTLGRFRRLDKWSLTQRVFLGRRMIYRRNSLSTVTMVVLIKGVMAAMMFRLSHLFKALAG